MTRPAPPPEGDAGRRLARWVLLAVLATTLGATVLLAGRAPAGAQDDLMAEGRQLYLVGCVSCHGTDGRGVTRPDGTVRGTTLERSGEAGAHYYLSTGRMPLANPEDQPRRNAPAYPPDEQAALVAYVASLGDGPALPELDLEQADLAVGGEAFRESCQACHAASGSGGALSYGRAAPSLSKSTPAQIAAAVRVGPGQMPVFGPSEISDARLNDVVRYVGYLQDPEDPGGIPMGRIGPVPEGFVAWFIGVTLLLACVFWIGTRSPARRRRRP